MSATWCVGIPKNTQHNVENVDIDKTQQKLYNTQ